MSEISKGKVLVTGADGFIGSHMVELLVDQGYDVRAMCLYNSFGELGWLDSLGILSCIETISGDIRDTQFCRNAMKEVNTVFHLAALIGIPYSYSAPQSYIETNVMGTLNICQAALDMGVSRVVHTSTSEVYGTAQYVPIDEKHPLQPQSPYSASKIGADTIAMSFYNSFDLPLVVARPFNTYGPRQSARAVIPTIIIQLASGVTELKLGDLRPTRDLNYVLDTCLGMYALATCEDAVGETVNIGSGGEISIGDLANKIQRLMGTTIPIVQENLRLRPDNSEVLRLCCDGALLSQLTEFKHTISLETGLKKTIDWFESDQIKKFYKPDKYNV